MQITTYLEAREYLESFIYPSIYKRIAKKENMVDPLERMRVFLALLDNPQNEYASIIVTGTSGKGSTAYILSEVLQRAGYQTGLTMSPHLQKLNERMQIHGKSIPDDAFLALLNTLIPTIDEMTRTIGSPTYYEILLAMAFIYFANQAVDIVVAEVGLEGEYDGTNVLSPLLTILTNISLDHTELLGDTVEKIAMEAVNAIKPSNTAVITGRLQDSVKSIIEKKMQETHVSTRVSLGEQFDIEHVHGTDMQTWFSYRSKSLNLDDIEISLSGLYQAENASLAMTAALHLQKNGFFKIRPGVVFDMFSSLLLFPGRFETSYRHGVPWILDGAHNPAKMKAFIGSLKKIEPESKKIFVVAFKKDKDIREMMESIYPAADTIIVTSFQGTADMTKNAAASLDSLRSSVTGQGFGGNIYFEHETTAALEKAVDLAKEKDALIVVTGSLYLVGDVRTLIANQLHGV